MVEFRRRRIIYNDDCGERWSAGKDGREAFLAARFDWCRNSQVDSYFWCVGNGEEPCDGRPDPPELGDADAVMAEAAHEAGMEVFASLRMNDTHDAVAPKLTYPLKVQRPDLLVGEKKEYPIASIMALGWSSFDYAKEEVRRHRLEYIERICSRHDWDGLEMDFCRHVTYFRMGEAQKNLDTMTGFVGEVRARLDRIADARGRPYLVAVRVPPTIEHSRRIGLDIERWLANGYVDILIAGAGYFPYSVPYRELIDLGHRFGVPVYPCINVSVATPHATGDKLIRERMRGMASNLWYEGADGVYLFNCFVPVEMKQTEATETYPVLSEIGDPATLAPLDKIYCAEEARTMWVHVQYTAPPCVLPARLVDCVPIPLKIGDPLEAAARDGRLSELTLRLRLTDILDEENVELRVNGVPVSVHPAGKEQGERNVMGVITTLTGTWFEGKVGAPPLRRGENTVRVLPSTGCWVKDSTAIQEVQLVVRYEP